MARENPSAIWDFVYNNPTVDEQAFLDILVELPIRWAVFQHELAPTTGTPHFQGGICFATKQRQSSVIRLLPGCSVRKLRTTPLALADYCRDPAKRTVGHNPMSFGDVPEPRPIPIKNAKQPVVKRVYTAEENGILPREEFSIWQQHCIAFIDAPVDPRAIHWYWEPKGKTGKSRLAKHIVYHYPGAICVSGGARHIECAIADRRELTGEYPTILLYDVPRACGAAVSFQIIERVKNGLMFSQKYHSDMHVFPSMHVICFANQPPNMEGLSEDRWNVYEINPIGLDLWAPATQGYAPLDEQGHPVDPDVIFGTPLEDLPLF